VSLFTNLEFVDFNSKSFDYTPPKNCPGPWTKVVFKADFTVTAGLQNDRTEQFYLGGANLLFGTTPEPRTKLSPSWHVENDVTDLSALLLSPQQGSAILGNFVGISEGQNYTGVIYSTASLVFFPASSSEPAAVVPDVVIGIPGNGGAATLGSSNVQLTQSVTLPKNVEAAYLDLIAQNQSHDEFWFLCVPSDLAAKLQSCGNTGFRETEVSIDGIPAGVAPVYPWIFTGGVDPYLWEPIPGVQTLNFKPFRVDLTPFAGLLSDGKPHVLAIGVFNADSYFATEGNLLIYLDKGSGQVTGKVLLNTLSAVPSPAVEENLQTFSNGNIFGSVKVSSHRQYTIIGDLHTSHGLVRTEVDGKFVFNNTQNFVIDESEYKQALVQLTDTEIASRTTENGTTTLRTHVFSYPLGFDYDEVLNSDGTATVYNVSDQKYQVTDKTIYLSQTSPVDVTLAPLESAISNEVYSADDLFFDESGKYIGHSGQSSQNYLGKDSTGYCYSEQLTAKNLRLTGYLFGAECPIPAAPTASTPSR
jgi:hypothetical protein